MLIDRAAIHAEGIYDEEMIEKMLDRASVYEAKGIADARYINKALKRDMARAGSKPGMRTEPAPLAVAVEETTSKSLEGARKRIRQALQSPVAKRGALMPDACVSGSAEAAMPVGGVLETCQAIVPAAHGSDIACSVYATFYPGDAPISEEMDALVASTRFGSRGRDESVWISHPVTEAPVWDNPFLKGLERYARMHLGDQGNGNHFSFLGEMRWTPEVGVAMRASGHSELAESIRNSGANSVRVVVSHHGSRGLGSNVYLRGLKAALKQTRKVATEIPEEAAWLDARSEQGVAYWEALQYLWEWTRANHSVIHDGFLSRIGEQALGSVGNAHNFIWRRGDRYLHGKGATPAWPTDQGSRRLGLIPLNMASPILLTLGGAAQDFLSFSPHGAGRELSRSRFRERFFRRLNRSNPTAIDDAISASTETIDARWYLGNPDVGEIPEAYKSPEAIRSQITQFELAEIVAEIHPRGSVMAGSNSRSKDDPEPLTPKRLRQIEHRAERRKGRQSGWRDAE